MGMRRAMPLFDDASLLHTDRAMGVSAFAAVNSVPAWPAFAVVTRTSICLRPQATCIIRRPLPAQQTTQLVPASSSGVDAS